MKTRVRPSNPAGTKLVKRFIKASKQEFPPYVPDLVRLAPKDKMLERWGLRK